ncbi:MAG: diacylglycerol kinase family protein [Paracoccaceae bacterium]
MVCCTIIALIIGAAIWLVRRLSFGLLSNPSDPLAWSLQDDTAATPAQRDFSVQDRCASFSHALRGIAVVARSEHNMWLHLGAAACVGLLGVVLNIDLAAWRWIAACIGLVLFAETVNTAIEALCDALHPSHAPAIGLVKDIAAGAVLICAVSAAVIGALTFAPYL